ncbi:DUF3060 domain-containing protein [Sphingobacteriaceae bacterium WQ 2009]|uniref:DUF3060 domain-containing protein n=1 Tax=Rhinopithecimicrobium faecis TaxID=2820698 RepID=A0A8T4HCM8_9SPHI|nr:DUF3060 domain-containing protein [Sphingobacteriaceae bacterium WQ 2009]
MRKIKFIIGVFALVLTVTAYAANRTYSSGLYHTDDSFQKEYIEVNGVEVKKTINATGKEIILINGVNNDITITGTCQEIIVAGSGHRVNAEEVRSIKVEGTNNTVYYKRATASDGRIVSSVSGVDNAVERSN